MNENLLQSLVPPRLATAAQIVDAIAAGHHTFSAIETATGIAERTLARALARLVSSGLLLHHGREYAIVDPESSDDNMSICHPGNCQSGSPGPAGPDYKERQPGPAGPGGAGGGAPTAKVAAELAAIVAELRRLVPTFDPTPHATVEDFVAAKAHRVDRWRQLLGYLANPTNGPILKPSGWIRRGIDKDWPPGGVAATAVARPLSPVQGGAPMSGDPQAAEVRGTVVPFPPVFQSKGFAMSHHLFDLELACSTEIARRHLGSGRSFRQTGHLVRKVAMALDAAGIQPGEVEHVLKRAKAQSPDPDARMALAQFLRCVQASTNVRGQGAPILLTEYRGPTDLVVGASLPSPKEEH